MVQCYDLISGFPHDLVEVEAMSDDASQKRYLYSGRSLLSVLAGYRNLDGDHATIWVAASVPLHGLAHPYSGLQPG